MLNIKIKNKIKNNLHFKDDILKRIPYYCAEGEGEKNIDFAVRLDKFFGK